MLDRHPTLAMLGLGLLLILLKGGLQFVATAFWNPLGDVLPLVNGAIWLAFGVILYSAVTSKLAGRVTLPLSLAMHLAVYLSSNIAIYLALPRLLSASSGGSIGIAAEGIEQWLLAETGRSGIVGYFLYRFDATPSPFNLDEMPDDIINLLLFGLSRGIRWLISDLFGVGLPGLVDLVFWYAASWVGVAFGIKLARA
jgi:hypothetical protein